MRINNEDGQYVARLRLLSKDEEVREEAEKTLEGNRFAILVRESEEVLTRRA